MAFLNAKWVVRRSNVPLTFLERLVIHEAKKLEKKKNNSEPRITEDEQEVFAEPSDSDFELPLGRSLAGLPN